MCHDKSLAFRRWIRELERLTGVEQGPTPPRTRPRLLRWILLVLGTLCVGFAIVGLVLPIVPTVDFLLLAALCFANSSPRAYSWLHTNRLFGRRLRDYRERHGATVATKAWTFAALVLGMGATLYFVSPPYWLDAILAVIAVGVTLHLLKLKTLRD